MTYLQNKNLFNLNDNVQRFSLTYFNRPIGPNALSFWRGSGLNSEQLAEAFSKTSEYKLTVDSKGLEEIINGFYQNLFKRNVESGGLNYWKGLITSGKISKHDVGRHIGDTAMAGPNNTDKIALKSKLSFANTFTAELEKQGSDNYKGDEAISKASALLSSVFDTNSIPPVSIVFELVRSLVSEKQTQTPDTVVSGGGGGGGHHPGFIPRTSDFTLSLFDDVVDENGFTRSNPENNAVTEIGGFFLLDATAQAVSGTGQTFGLNDMLVDSSGSDTDSLTLTGIATALPGATVTNIETVNVTGDWTTDVTLFTPGSITGGDLFDINGTIATHAATTVDLTINATNSGFSQINVAGITAAGVLANAPVTIITADPTVSTTIVGSVLRDIIGGSSQADDINGGGGVDSISGNGGDDTFRYTSAEFVGGESLDGGANTDTVVISTAAAINDAAFTNKSNLEAITLGNFINALALGANAAAATSSLTVTGGTNNDTISAAALGEAITIIAGDGIDGVTGSDKSDTINLTETTAAVDTVTHAGSGVADYDTITGFTATNAVDLITFAGNAAKVGGAAVTGYASGALANLAAATGFQVFSNDITVANSVTGPTEAEIETYLGATEVFQNGATNDAVYIAADNGIDTVIF